MTKNMNALFGDILDNSFPFWSGTSVVKTTEPRTKYPPYNLYVNKETGGNRIEVAVAGFRQEDISVGFHDNIIHISGKKPTEENELVVVHRGIAAREFSFELTADWAVQVTDAVLNDGILTVDVSFINKETLKSIPVRIGTETIAE